MDAIALLRRAHEVGLRVEPNGGKLMVRGPKKAEPVVKLLAAHKAEVLAALAREAVEASTWQDRFIALSFEWSIGARDWETAQRLAWGDLENHWHRTRGRRWPSWQCAGCDALIGGLAALDLPDGNRVHFENIECLITYGRRWRGEAHAGLVSPGLEPPVSLARTVHQSVSNMPVKMPSPPRFCFIHTKASVVGYWTRYGWALAW
jgi:hypothetical protein